MMILLIRRKWILGSVVLLLTAATVLSFYAKPPAVAALSYIELPKSEMIILDAGHGGSDGGAVSTDGTPESGINLAIAQRLQDFFVLMGRETMLTRTSAASLAGQCHIAAGKGQRYQKPGSTDQQCFRGKSNQHPPKHIAGTPFSAWRTGVLWQDRHQRCTGTVCSGGPEQRRKPGKREGFKAYWQRYIHYGPCFLPGNFGGVWFFKQQQ